MTSRGFPLSWKQVQSFTPVSNLPQATFSDHLHEFTSPNPSCHSLLAGVLLLFSWNASFCIQSWSGGMENLLDPTQFFACVLHETFPNTLTGSSACFYEPVKVILSILKMPCDGVCSLCPFRSGTLSSPTVGGPTPYAKATESFIQTSLFPILPFFFPSEIFFYISHLTS